MVELGRGEGGADNVVDLGEVEWHGGSHAGKAVVGEDGVPAAPVARAGLATGQPGATESVDHPGEAGGRQGALRRQLAHPEAPAWTTGEAEEHLEPLHRHTGLGFEPPLERRFEPGVGLEEQPDSGEAVVVEGIAGSSGHGRTVPRKWLRSQ